jgi:hypothetical protein
MKLFHQLHGAKHMPQGHHFNNHHNNKELKNYRLPDRKSKWEKKSGFFIQGKKRMGFAYSAG